MLKRVLVVDDNEGIREVAKEILQDVDCEVLTAENGEQAIEIMTETPADVVLLDINMPVTDGWETLRVIKDEYNGWPESQVIMLSVKQEPENPLKAWSIGAHYYLPKPFSMANLLELVERALKEPTAA